MENNKYCNTCKSYHDIKEFIKIISRRDYGLHADNEGITLYLKELKQCLNCRCKNTFYKNLEHKK